MVKIEIVESSAEPQQNYLLSHGSLAKIPDKGRNGTVNLPCLREDLDNGRLDQYRGSWVAYHKGVLCGESSEGRGLYEAAWTYYGKSNLTIFRVFVS